MTFEEETRLCHIVVEEAYDADHSCYWQGVVFFPKGCKLETVRTQLTKKMIEWKTQKKQNLEISQCIQTWLLEGGIEILYDAQQLHVII